MAEVVLSMPQPTVRMIKEAVNATANALHGASAFADADQSQLTAIPVRKSGAGKLSQEIGSQRGCACVPAGRQPERGAGPTMTPFSDRYVGGSKGLLLARKTAHCHALIARAGRRKNRPTQLSGSDSLQRRSSIGPHA